MDTLTREEFLAAAKQRSRKTRWVPVPELGEGKQMLVAEWGARERDLFDSLCRRRVIEGRSSDSPRAVTVAASVVDPDTLRPIFDPDDVDALAETCFRPIDRLFRAAAELNPVRDDVIEDAAKNS